MQIFEGKKYNEYKIGGMVLLVPVYGKQAERFLFGELKEFMHILKALGEEVHEENRQMYLEAREQYDRTYKRLQEIEGQLAIMPGKHDITTLETRRLLGDEKRELEGKLYHLSDKVDQLFDRSFVTPTPSPEEAKSEPVEQKRYQPNLAGTGGHEVVIDTQSDGHKVRQLRHQLGEDQRTFAKRFKVTQGMVSNWETNKTKPPQEALEMQPAKFDGRG